MVSSRILIFPALYQHQTYLICSDDSFNVLQKEEINKMLKQNQKAEQNKWRKESV